MRLLFILLAPLFLLSQSQKKKSVVSYQAFEEIIFGTTSGIAGDVEGFAEYHWNDLSVVSNPNLSTTEIGSSSDGIKGTQEWGNNQMYVVGNRLHFYLDPVSPVPTTNAGHNSVDIGNKRTECYFCTSAGSFTLENPVGTIETFGYNAKFPSNYVIDTASEWLLYQSKPNDENGNSSPPISIIVAPTDYLSLGTVAGELLIHNNVTSEYIRTNLVPQPGGSYDFVMMIKHDPTNGDFKFWVNDVVEYDGVDIATMYTPSSGAGTSKFGIYKWPWANQAGIDNSSNAGVSFTTYNIGPLRVYREFIGHSGYGTSRYDLVKPQ